jgi:hypothetical protein
VAELVTPGHPLLTALIAVVLERHGDVLRQGAVLIDDDDDGEALRVLTYLEHSVRDGRTTRSGEPRLVSRRLEFVELDATGVMRPAGPAPYLDYRPASEEEQQLLAGCFEASWLGDNLEDRCLSFAIEKMVPAHLAEVRRRIDQRVTHTMRAVRERLTAEITHWDRRAEKLKAQEQAGKQPRMNWQRARQRVENLQRRLSQRSGELERERSLSALPPRVIGGALVVPRGLLERVATGTGTTQPESVAFDRDEIERLAVDAVLAAEKALGREPREMPPNNPGYDIESRDPKSGRLIFLEVKGKTRGVATVTISRTQIMAALNTPERWALAIVEIVDGKAGEPRYLKRPFTQEPEFTTASINYDLGRMLAQGVAPADCSFADEDETCHNSAEP